MLQGHFIGPLIHVQHAQRAHTDQCPALHLLFVPHAVQAPTLVRQGPQQHAIIVLLVCTLLVLGQLPVFRAV